MKAEFENDCGPSKGAGRRELEVWEEATGPLTLRNWPDLLLQLV